MALEYACLQLHIAAGTELPRERILYAVTSYMDRMGMIPCGQENATRTICFAPSEAGWSVYDDCADRLDIPSIDGLGRCLTGKIDCRAVGILASKEGLMLRLYGGGPMSPPAAPSAGNTVSPAACSAVDDAAATRCAGGPVCPPAARSLNSRICLKRASLRAARFFHG